MPIDSDPLANLKATTPRAAKKTFTSSVRHSEPQCMEAYGGYRPLATAACVYVVTRLSKLCQSRKALRCLCLWRIVLAGSVPEFGKPRSPTLRVTWKRDLTPFWVTYGGGRSDAGQSVARPDPRCRTSHPSEFARCDRDSSGEWSRVTTLNRSGFRPFPPVSRSVGLPG